MRFSRRNTAPLLLVLMSTVCSTGLVAGDVTDEGPVASGNGAFVSPGGSIQVAAAGDSTPITQSGTWTRGGFNISRMILHDLIFFVDSDTNPPCSFSVNFVLSEVSSRTIRRFDLAVGASAQLHFEAGIDTNDLRFGTIGLGTCVRNWAAMGVPRPELVFADGFESLP